MAVSSTKDYLKVPQDILQFIRDPVTKAPLIKAVSFPCGHNANKDTAISLCGRMINGQTEKSGNCPECDQSILFYSKDQRIRNIAKQLLTTSFSLNAAQASSPSVVADLPNVDSVPLPGPFTYFSLENEKKFSLNDSKETIAFWDFHSATEGSLVQAVCFIKHRDGSMHLSIKLSRNSESLREKIDRTKKMKFFCEQLKIEFLDYNQYYSKESKKIKKLFPKLEEINMFKQSNTHLLGWERYYISEKTSIQRFFKALSRHYFFSKAHLDHLSALLFY
jgi:hypothetical protein